MISTLLGLIVLASSPASRGEPVPDAPAPTFLALASMMIQSGDVEKARDVLRDGMQQHPNFPGFHLPLGETHAAKGDDALAFYEFQWEVLKFDPKHPVVVQAATRSAEMMRTSGKDAREMKAVTVALQKSVEDPAAASAMLSEIREKRGSFVLTVFEAEWAAASGDRDAAKQLFREALKRDPGFVPAYVGLSRLVDEKEAKDLLAKARALDAHHWSLK